MLSTRKQKYLEFGVGGIFLAAIALCATLSRVSYVENPKIFCLLTIGAWAIWDGLILTKFLHVSSAAILLVMLPLVVSSMLPFLPKLSDTGITILHGSLILICLPLMFKASRAARPAEKS